MKKPALLIIDMINDGFEDWDNSSRKALTENINLIACAFRAKRLPVIWVRQEFEADLRDAFLEMRERNIKKYIKGTSGPELLGELSVSPEDHVIIKKRYSAFFNTPLDSLLAELRADLLMLAGINTHACIRMTAIDAYQRDRRVILASDCISSYNLDWHQSSIEYMKDRVATLQTNDEIKSVLDSIT